MVGAGNGSRRRDRRSAAGDPDALASGGLPRRVHETQLQIVEHLLEQMGLLLGPIAGSLGPEQAQQIDGFLGLFQIEHALACGRISRLAKIHESRARQHDEEPAQIGALRGRARGGAHHSRPRRLDARGWASRRRGSRRLRRSRGRCRFLVSVVTPPTITDFEGFVFSHGVSSWEAGQSLARGPDTFKEPRSSMYNVLAIPGSPMADSTGPLFEALLSLMGRLRAEGGCPWDREQTRASLRPYLIEETYEALEALDAGETGHIVEELGDVLFQVVFHCQIAQEQGEFTMADVLQAVLQKMTRRHPHVFGNTEVANSGQALRQWERIKRAEVEGDEVSRSVLDGVPKSLPSLLRAQRLQVKAGRVGFDWPTWREAWSKVREEIAETDEAMAAGDAARVKAELGDLLFSLVNVARLLEIDAEGSLRQAADTFTRRFKEVEAAMRAEGRQVEEASAEELDRQWLAVKAREGLERSGEPS